MSSPGIPQLNPHFILILSYIMAISNTIQAIDATIQTLGATAPSDGDRQELLAAARKLQAALESPLDTLVSIVMPVCPSPLTIVKHCHADISRVTSGSGSYGRDRHGAVHGATWRPRNRDKREGSWREDWW
jgi:hypothetical protein